jgi:hypothetical protein
MYFASFLMPRSGSWPMWLAVRSTATAVTGIVVAMFIGSAALPKMAAELQASELQPPAPLGVLVANPQALPMLPVPGLLLGIGAILLRPLRGPLAILAAIASTLAMVLIVGTLVGALVPMYNIPVDLLE